MFNSADDHYKVVNPGVRMNEVRICEGPLYKETFQDAKHATTLEKTGQILVVIHLISHEVFYFDCA